MLEQHNQVINKTHTGSSRYRTMHPFGHGKSAQGDQYAQHLWLPLTFKQESCRQSASEHRWPPFILHGTQRGEFSHSERQLRTTSLVIVRQCWGVLTRCCGMPYIAELSLPCSRKRLLNSELILSPGRINSVRKIHLTYFFVRGVRKEPTIALVLLQLLLRCVWFLTSFSDVTSCSRRFLYPVTTLRQTFFWYRS